MLLKTVFYSLVLISTVVSAQQCATPKGTGPCTKSTINGVDYHTCADDFACLITAADPVGFCCAIKELINPVTTTKSPARPTIKTSTNADCVDKKNPATGKSDCPQMKAYCQKPEYYDLMTEECPLTCNRCGPKPQPNTGTCQDGINPRTGTSDCPMRKNLCNDPVYYDVMTRQCPKTCGRC